jgi:hypothetical protein
MIEGRGQGMTADQPDDQQEELLDFLPQAELLEIPESNFSPGLLSFIWQRKAAISEEQAEVNLALRRDRFQQQVEQSKKRDDEHLRAEILFHEKMQEIQERTEQLLIRAQEEELLANEHMRQVEKRALVLCDGRRAYVDGKDDYRDEKGAVLQGADKEEAQRLREAKPNAATWSEHAEAAQRQEEARHLKEDVQKLHDDAGKENGQGLSTDELDAKRKNYDLSLSDYESKLRDLADKNATGSEKVTDDALGGSDYMAAYGGTERTISFASTLDKPQAATMGAAFTAAAAGQGAPVKPASAVPAPANPATAPSA